MGADGWSCRCSGGCVRAVAVSPDAPGGPGGVGLLGCGAVLPPATDALLSFTALRKKSPLPHIGATRMLLMFTE